VLALLSHSLEATLTRQIQSALRAPPLVNYDGWLCFVVWDGRERLNSETWEIELDRSFGRLTFEAWLQADRPGESGRSSVAVSVEDGEDRDEAEFEIRFDCDGFRLSTTGEMVMVERRGVSRRIECQAEYDFSRPEGSGDKPADFPPNAEASRCLLWIMLFQQNRLVQTITLHFRRPGSGNAS
jgi:hypothetical protein